MGEALAAKHHASRPIGGKVFVGLCGLEIVDGMSKFKICKEDRMFHRSFPGDSLLAPAPTPRIDSNPRRCHCKGANAM